jgi:triphosphatase
MSIPREIELKLEVPAHSVARLSRSSVLNVGVKPRKPATLVSVYFDTKKHKLRSKGLSLRVRRIGRRHVQTVKQGEESTALFARGEWENEIGSAQPDLDVAHHTPLKPLIGKKLGRSLMPLFETRIRRTVYPIRNGKSEIELTIDRGKIEAGRRSSPLCEVELELKRGEPADLFKAARVIAREVPVQLAIASKAQRGYSLVDGKEPEAIKAAPVALTPDSTGDAAFRAIARACLRQLVANQPVLLCGEAEALHQMRVALRRLRSAISLFAGMLSDRQTAEMKAQLKWISAELGPAREFDVFIRRVLTPVSQDKPAGTGIAVLAKDLQQKREEAFDRARSAVESVRFRELMIDVSAWIETGDWTRNGDDRASGLRVRPIAALAADEVNRRWKSILKRGARLKRLDAQGRHKLRIQAKKLRYASEFFAGAFPGKKAKERRVDFLDGLEGLQDALGDLNDIAVHEELTAQIADTREVTGKRRAGRTKKAFAAGRLSGREEARAASVLKDAQHAYRVFARAKPYWL